MLNESILVLEQLAIGYRQQQKIRIVAGPIETSLSSGRMVCLVGPNGAGKSTLLRTLAGIQKPMHGHVRLSGQDIYRLSPEKLAKQLAVVLTERIEVENLSVYALVALGRHPYTDWAGRLLAEDERVVQRALLDVGAAHLAHRHLGELSDGERQRVMIARALAQQPNVLILDEPTAFLDLPHRVEILSLLSRLARQNSCAILLSTHDLDLALRMADRLWLLPGNGQLVSGAPEELVLNQALTQAFHSEDVFFDMSQGGFRVRRYPCGPIDLYGEGVVAHWTAHALERIGFEVIQNAARPISPACIEVLRESGSAHWRLTVQRQTTIYTSLSDLVDYVASTPKMIHLEARHPETRHPGTRSERRNSTISMI